MPFVAALQSRGKRRIHLYLDGSQGSAENIATFITAEFSESAIGALAPRNRSALQMRSVVLPSLKQLLSCLELKYSLRTISLALSFICAKVGCVR